MALDHFLESLSAIAANWTLLGPKNTHCYWDYNEKQSTQNEKFILAKSEVLKKQESLLWRIKWKTKMPRTLEEE